jgi:surfactin synthase thioesterase subunit
VDAGEVASVPVVQALTAPRPEQTMAVLAVPYAAGDGVVYHALAQAVPPEIAVHAVNNPRRFERDPAALDGAVEAYLDEVVTAVRRDITVPVVVWGHCVGYALALSLTRRLLAAGVPVRALAVGGVVIDADHAVQSAQLGACPPPIEKQDVAALLSRAGLGHVEAGEWDVLVDRFAQDSLLSAWCNHEHFCRASSPRLPVPLLCMVARDDPLTPDGVSAAHHWTVVSEQVQVVELDGGGHYFVKTRSRDVAAALAVLAKAGDAPQRDASEAAVAPIVDQPSCDPATAELASAK